MQILLGKPFDCHTFLEHSHRVPVQRRFGEMREGAMPPR
jgi:hypothetical protein